MPDGDRAGQGSSPFRAFLRELPDDIANAREIGLPVVLERTTPLAPHAQRLMDTLGVEVRIVSDVAFDRVRRSSRGRTMGHFDRPPDSSTNGHGPRADWIDYRASIARTFKRKKAGELPIQCEQCDTELDVDDVVHSPKCPVFLGEQPKTKAADWDANAVITAIRLWAGEHDDEAPSSEQWRVAMNGYPSYAIVVQLFGSWNDGIKAAGFEPRASHRERLEEREPEADGAGMRPTVSQADSNVEPASRSSSRTMRPNGYWTRETIIAAIQEWAADHDGVAPTATEWFKPSGGRWPAVSRARELFGSWSKAIEAAGFTPQKGGRRKDAKPATGAAADVSRGADNDRLVPEALPQEQPVTPEQPSEPEPDTPPGLNDTLASLHALTTPQLIAAGRVVEAIAEQLRPLEKPDRSAVWQYIAPFVDEVLGA